jgi:membrane associated rhomboid family serine protease
MLGSVEAPSDIEHLPAEAALRRTTDPDRADEWMLVLAASGHGGTLAREVGADGVPTFVVSVAAADEVAARRALDAYDRENAAGSSPAAPTPVRGSGFLGFALALGLLSFHLVVAAGLGGSRGGRWLAAGVADAAAIRAGAWWRALTALTLHGDVVHLGGNIVASLLFGSAAARWLGPGIAAALILASAFGANVLTAFVKPHQISLGASTATFAALGLVAGLQVVWRWRGGGPLRKRAWLAFGAGMALFAMLGVGQHADVYAHLFGILLGFVVGMGAGAVLDRSPPPAPPPWRSPAGALQIALGLGAAAALAGAWLRALGA